METTRTEISTFYKVPAYICMLILSLALVSNVQGQILDSENKLAVVLKDGTHVILYGKAKSLSDEMTKDYYYLPVNPKLSFRPDGTPEFLFTKFTTEERADNGGVSGALLHFLMEWGLTPDQEKELKGILEKQHNGAKLLGPVDVQSAGDNSFRIISATVNESEDGFTQSLITSGASPPLPGLKVAVAAKLDKNGAQLLANTFEKSQSITDLSIELSFAYTLRYPGARGRAEINWEKFHSLIDSTSAEYKHDVSRKWRHGIFNGLYSVLFGRAKQHTYSYSEMQELIQEMHEQKIVTVEFDEGQDSEKIDKVREAFFDYFLNQLTDDIGVPELPQNNTESSEVPDIRKGKRYTFNRTKIQKTKQTGKKVLNLTHRISIEKTFAITGNLASWYHGVRDNPKCVSSVNLNDPFFQHRDIYFILDLEAKEMFDQEVNYVTVNTRKRRSSGHDFSDRVTIDKKFVEEHGINASMTYARGEDRDPDTYEYQAQWSLRGGNVYPQNPQWSRGQWEGVTLKPPVTPRTVEFEADLEELKLMDITRATLQVRYKKFGREVEENLHLSPAKQEPLTDQMLFMDRDTRGYVYRLVFNHKTEGKLALPWSSKVNDNYVYAVIPEDFQDKTSQIFAKAKKAAEVIVKDTSSDGTVTTGSKILDRFSEILDVVIEN